MNEATETTREILQCGPSEERRGGMRTVMEQLLDERFHPGIRSRIVPTAARTRRIGAFVSGYLECRRLLRIGGVACLHIHMSENASVWRAALLVRLAHRYRSHAIIQSHGGEIQTFYEGLNLAPVRRWLFQQIGLADALVVLTEAWANWWRLITPCASIRVIPNFVEIPERVLPCTAYHKKQQGSVLFLGELGDRKGTPTLVEAASLVIAAHPDAEFHFGGGGEIARFEEQADGLGISRNCTFHGWVEGEEKASLLAGCDVLVLPSRFESFGIVLLEAMAYGKPVICSDGGQMKEIVSDGVDGFLFKVGDVSELAAKIDLILCDPVLARQMGARGRRKVEDAYSEDVVMSLWRDLYEEVAS